MNTRSKMLLAASLATALTAPIMAQGGGGMAKEEAKAPEKVHCYGVNKCKGVGDCGGVGHSCAGKNSCKHQGYIDMDKDTCLKLDGGSLTPVTKK